MFDFFKKDEDAQYKLPLNDNYKKPVEDIDLYMAVGSLIMVLLVCGFVYLLATTGELIKLPEITIK